MFSYLAIYFHARLEDTTSNKSYSFFSMHKLNKKNTPLEINRKLRHPHSEFPEL